MTDTCKSCGRSYAACQYPLSHGHATVDNIKLPGRVNRILSRRGALTLQDRMGLNAIQIFAPDFTTDVDTIS